MKLHLKKLEEEVPMWQNTSVHPRRFGGMDFQFGNAETDTSIAMESLTSPSRVRNALLDGLAEEHQFLPQLGKRFFRSWSREALLD